MVSFNIPNERLLWRFNGSEDDAAITGTLVFTDDGDSMQLHDHIRVEHGNTRNMVVHTKRQLQRLRFLYCDCR